MTVSDGTYTERMTTPVTIRVPDDLLAQLDALVPARHSSRSDALRRALELYLYRVACERDVEAYEHEPMTDAELALGDEPGNWEATPAW